MSVKVVISKGDIFNSLTVISEAVKSNSGKRRFNCKCFCGNPHTVTLGDLRSGKVSRCKACSLRARGVSRSTHGMSKTRFYSIWQGIKKRCDNPNHIEYDNYGGRGISYCQSWRSFECFFADMYDTYTDELTIERNDVNGDYCKDNCSWIPMREQFENKRNTKMVTYMGETKPLIVWCRELDLVYGTVKRRLLRGHTPEIAFSNGSLKKRNEDGTYANCKSTTAQ